MHPVQVPFLPTAFPSVAAAAHTGLHAAGGEESAPSAETDPITVLVCESQPVTAAGIRALLENASGFQVIEECQQLAGTREILRHESPSIIILDKALGMQAVLDWIADLKILLTRRNVAHPPAIVVWGVSMTESEALRFLQAGARGIIRKTASPKALLACLRTVALGKNWMEDSVFREAPQLVTRQHRSDLTPREQQVMELVEQGLKNREIARELGIRPGTVKIHLKHIFEKTGVRGRYGLALTGMREKGLLALSGGASVDFDGGEEGIDDSEGEVHGDE